MPNLLIPFRFALGLAALLAGVWLVYAPGLNAAFRLDDFQNLGLLDQVVDLDTLLLFVTSGSAGPGGRPVALASFLLNQVAWPVDPSAFLKTNLQIHLLNGVLLAWLTLQLARRRGLAEGTASVAALAASALWLLHPMFASTTLYAVQRMTSLSVTFVLAGLVGYVAARGVAARRPLAGAAGIVAAIGLGTTLAFFSKENGALLPALAWLVDAAFFRGEPDEPRRLRHVRIAMTRLPALAIVTYAAYKLPSMPAAYVGRDFTLGERLLTECRVLFDYLRLLLMPVRSSLGLFHDDYEISRSLVDPPGTLTAVVGWAALVVVAVAARRRAPLFAFAVGWFLVAHSVESSVFPLELYFEHRNYLPAAGLAVAAALAVAGLEIRLRRLAFWVGAAYVGLLSFVLFETATQWGEPSVAATLWYLEHPNSERALQTYAQSLAAARRFDALTVLFEDAVARFPDKAAYPLQLLITRCIANQPPTPADLTNAAAVAQRARINYAAGDSLDKLANLAIDGDCGGLGKADVRVLADAFLANPQYRGNGVVAYQLYLLKARLYDAEGDFGRTLESLESAQSARDYPEVNLMIAAVLTSKGRYDEALAGLDAAAARLPPYAPSSRVWRRKIDELRQAIVKLKPMKR